MTEAFGTPEPCLQWGKACRPTKGEDRVFAFPLANGKGLLVGVADGISSSNGEAAAQWIQDTMCDIAKSESDAVLGARRLYKLMSNALAAPKSVAGMNDSSSTLSCGVCQFRSEEGGYNLHFEFFAVGDSPIWRVMRAAHRGGLRFQASPVYSSPTPSEQGLVYSYVSLLSGKVEGRPHFGAVELAEDELLVMASDGVPEWRIFGEDQDPKYSSHSPQLVDRLFEAARITDDLVREALLGYERSGMLIDDDASIIAVRWRYPVPVPSDDQKQSTVVGPAISGTLGETESTSICASNLAGTIIGPAQQPTGHSTTPMFPNYGNVQSHAEATAPKKHKRKKHKQKRRQMLGRK